MAKYTVLISSIFLLSFFMASLESAPTGRKVTLISSDGEAFDVDEAVAAKSEAIKEVMDGDSGRVGIPLPNVRGEILAKVVEYAERHVQHCNTTVNGTYCVGDIWGWDNYFMKVMDNCTLFGLYHASRHLGVDGLDHLTRRAVFSRVFLPMLPTLMRTNGMSCWSILGCDPTSGGWMLVRNTPEKPEDVAGGVEGGEGSTPDAGKEVLDEGLDVMDDKNIA